MTRSKAKERHQDCVKETEKEQVGSKPKVFGPT